MVDKKYSYDRFETSGARVGQAAYDLMYKEQPTCTAEEMLEDMGRGVVTYIQEAAEKGYKEFKETFYIIHLFKKALTYHDIKNTMSQKAICFKEGPTNPSWYMSEKPNDTKTLYKVDAKNGIVQLLWTVPGWEDCKSVRKNPKLYDPKLVSWINEACQTVL